MIFFRCRFYLHNYKYNTIYIVIYHITILPIRAISIAKLVMLQTKLILNLIKLQSNAKSKMELKIVFQKKNIF